MPAGTYRSCPHITVFRVSGQPVRPPDRGSGGARKAAESVSDKRPSGRLKRGGGHAKPIIEHTGCAGAMISRAVLTDPWIFPDTHAYLTCSAVLVSIRR